MAKLSEIIGVGGQGKKVITWTEYKEATLHQIGIILSRDGWITLFIVALRADCYFSPTNKTYSTWVNSDADDKSVGGKLKLRIPKDEQKQFTFTASAEVGGFHTTYVVTSPRASNAKKTIITVGVQ